VLAVAEFDISRFVHLNVSYSHRLTNGTEVHGHNFRNAKMYDSKTVRLVVFHAGSYLELLHVSGISEY
jgi:hypothetical protein